MIKPFGKNKEVELDNLIDALMQRMADEDESSEEYAELLARVERLHKLKTKSRERRVSPDTLAIGAFGIIQVLVIIAYEQKHVMTSKAIPFVQKPH